MSFDHAKFYGNVPEHLFNAQKLLEAYTEEFGAMSDIEAEMLRKYRVNRSLCVKKARENKVSIPVTLIGDIVKGETAIDKEEHLKAKSATKKVQYKIEAIKERIYSIRHLSKNIDHQIKTQ